MYYIYYNCYKIKPPLYDVPTYVLLFYETNIMSLQKLKINIWIYTRKNLFIFFELGIYTPHTLLQLENKKHNWNSASVQT